MLTVSLLLVSLCSLGCAQTWGLGDRPPPPAAPVRLPSDAESERLEVLADRLDEALAEVNGQLDAAEASWGKRTPGP